VSNNQRHIYPIPSRRPSPSMQHSTSIEDLSLDYMPTHNSTSSSSASLNANHNPQRNSNSSSNSNIPHLIATNAANVAARSTNQTSRTVRSHWVRYTSDNWRHISRTSKVMLIFSITSMIVQVCFSMPYSLCSVLLNSLSCIVHSDRRRPHHIKIPVL
jgi:hypothetical protein